MVWGRIIDIRTGMAPSTDRTQRFGTFEIRWLKTIIAYASCVGLILYAEASRIERS